MKRLLLGFLAGASLWASGPLALASKKPDLPPLPNFDKRRDPRAEKSELPPGKAAAANVLHERVPGLNISVDSVLDGPAFISSREGFLTGPAGQGKGVQIAAAAGNHPHGPVRAFLNEHSALFGFGAQALDVANLKRDYITPHNGLRTAIWEQHLNGIPIFDSILMAHITRNGELVNVSSRFVSDIAAAVRGRAARPQITARDAVMAAAAALNEPLLPGNLLERDQPDGVPQKQRFGAAPQFDDDTTAELTWVPIDSQTMVLCWEIHLTSVSRGETFRLIVNAETGEVIIRRCLTVYISDATYNVYTSDSPSPFSPGHPTPLNAQPALVSRTLVTLSALNTNASPNGWINDADNETRGNNVDAHLDRDRNNQPDLPRPQGNPNRVFDFPLDLTQSPTTYGDAAVVQLFYWCNFMHDKLWELGFNEAAGNFQNNNFGRGGLGNDAVLADSQDGSGFNNANFTFRRDGFAPRIQMYIFDGPTPDRDGDLDAEVLCHEYTHGLSSRLVGGGVGISELQTAGMGEGWSDWYALTLLSEPGDDPGGNYAAGGYLTLDFFGLMQNYYYGIRRYPYSTNLSRNPLTFKDIDPTQASPHTGVPMSPISLPFDPTSADEVHNQGEVWCVTLWDLRANLIAKHGFTNGNRLALQLVTDGMKLSPVDPTFLQARDAIIQADLVSNGGANFFELWSAFAKRGMGSSATSPGSGTTAGIVEAFDLPGLGFNRAIVVDAFTGNGNGAIDFNECSELLVVLFNNDRNTAANIRATLTTTTPGVTISQGDSLYPNTPAFSFATNLTPFRIYISPAFVCGMPIDFDLDVVSASDTRTLRFRVASGLIGAPQRFDNFTPVSIPDARPTGVDSPVTVSGFSSLLAKITVSLYITHPYDFDLSMQLIGPDGTRVALSALHGDDGDNYGVACSPDTQRTTFDDKANVSISSGRAPFVGTFRPDQALAAFVGKPASAINGVWRLRVADNFFQDTGILQCWSLSLSPAVCLDGGGDCSTDISVSGSASAPALVGSNLVYSLVVANQSLNSARGVTLTDVLPPSLQFVSASSSRGACNFNGGTVTCPLGTLARRESANVTIVTRPTAEGLLTNEVSVATSVIDSVPTNNTASIVTLVRLPYPIIVQDVVTLASETGVPANGALDVGETVTLNFGLRNVGAVSTTDLQVKLLNG
ncbi:MAG TPA: M36 family metallopeptidase, partial [Candidatus Binatia bacterium]|nr:M36 family metallopeptidase [Candidatus Binatia bacterium]